MNNKTEKIIERKDICCDFEHMVVINPEWRDARYSYAVVCGDGRIEEVPASVRGNEIVDGKIVPIPHTITVRQARKLL